MPKQTFSTRITKGKIAFVANCPKLGVTSQGKTKEEAYKNLREAMGLYLDDADVQKMRMMQKQAC